MWLEAVGGELSVRTNRGSLVIAVRRLETQRHLEMGSRGVPVGQSGTPCLSVVLTVQGRVEV